MDVKNAEDMEDQRVAGVDEKGVVVQANCPPWDQPGEGIGLMS